MTTTDFATAHGTAAVTAELLGPDALLENLQLIADGVVAVAGFAVAAIRIRRGDHLVLVVDTGMPEEIGTRIPVQLMTDELLLADDWGGLQFVPHERGSSPDEGGWVVPDVVVSDAPDAWHPLDMLVAPLYDDQGVLRGTLAFDEPVDGRRPDAVRRRTLERFAGLASRAVLSAVERETFLEQVAMADTVKEIVRTTSAQLSLEGLIQESKRTLLDGFDAQQVWIKAIVEDGRAGGEFLPDDLTTALPPAIVAFAQEAARFCWRQQSVMTVGAHLPRPPHMDPEHLEHVLTLLAGIDMASLVFVPLGAGPECLGSLVLMRSDARRVWSAVECAALLDIGHDLGRATLNARTFEREHALVAELQALDTYKSQLIATVSHELKSPLTTVRGHLEMLQTGEVEIGDEAHASLTAIGRASQRMSRVIEDLLLLRQVGESAAPLDPGPVAVDELVEDALAMSALAIRTKRLHVDLQAPERPVVALGEHDELATVMHNLVSNAVKYTPSGRAVDVRLTYADDGTDEVVVVVHDEGLGISAEDQERLFTEFFRSTNPEAVEQPGTGLGLAIVKRIVERHHGSIAVTSELGRGSTFTIRLPGAPPHSSARAADAPLPLELPAQPA
ncbi:Signal transduction histidine kinase [Nocardioides scoriae]|uniref:histidine kinase n=1 Tax=Nocardioides scoriae TaxID=642780 RepID=A0A1H1M8X2_9ACTN|nr:GAF domain-containing sensor histidine kinase [Nocardioides scoriae]SDR83251.1 Signal transduction histidine kinase [Nocardioides scoriae]